jgi:hypothetical protein
VVVVFGFGEVALLIAFFYQQFQSCLLVFVHSHPQAELVPVNSTHDRGRS